MQVGLVRDQTGWMLDILGDPAQTGVVIVAGARGDAGQRDDRAGRAARAETEVDLAAVVVNRVLPELFGRGEEEVFERLRRARRRRPRCPPPSAGPVEPVLDGARLAVTLRRTRAAHLPALRERAPAGHAAALRALPVHAQPRRAGPPARWPRHLGEELGY